MLGERPSANTGDSLARQRRRRRRLFDLLLEKLVEELGSAARSESLPPCLSLVRNDSLTNVGRDLAPSSIGRSTPIHQILSIHGHMETSSQETHLSFRVILRKQQEIIRKTRSTPFYTHLCAQIDGGLLCVHTGREKNSVILPTHPPQCQGDERDGRRIEQFSIRQLPFRERRRRRRPSNRRRGGRRQMHSCR